MVQWATANYGPNGGTGLPSFCGAFSKKPYTFGINPGRATVRVTVTLAFPDGEVSKGTVTTGAAFNHNAGNVPPKGLAEIDAAAKSVFAPFAKGHGRASAPTVATSVKCAIVNAAKPVPVLPASGGL